MYNAKIRPYNPLQYIPRYKELVQKYESRNCCNCQEQFFELHVQFILLKGRLRKIEHMLEYGWTDLEGKLTDLGGREPWIDYGRDGDFLVDIPEPSVECK